MDAELIHSLIEKMKTRLTVCSLRAHFVTVLTKIPAVELSFTLFFLLLTCQPTGVSVEKCSTVLFENQSLL